MNGSLLSAHTVFVVNTVTASATDEGEDRFALVAPLNDQLVFDLCTECHGTMDAHEDEDGRLVPGRTLCLCEGCQ